jgi:Flp pilus assembly protein TadB
VPSRSDATTSYLLAEYEHLSDSFLKNEELGDRRVNLFLTLVTGLIAVLAATQPDATAAWAAGLLGVAVFGVVTFRRIVYRNIKSDEYKLAIAMVRQYFLSRDPELQRFVFFSKPDPRRRRRAWGRGGLSETVALTNCTALAAAAIVALASTSPTFAITVGIVVAALSAGGHWYYAAKAYAAANGSTTGRKGTP